MPCFSWVVHDSIPKYGICICQVPGQTSPWISMGLYFNPRKKWIRSDRQFFLFVFFLQSNGYQKRCIEQRPCVSSCFRVKQIKSRETAWTLVTCSSTDYCSAILIEEYPDFQPTWLMVWNMAFIFPFSWECHDPNWRTHSIIFQRARLFHHQPDHY